MSVKIKKRRQERINLTDYLAIFTEDNCNYTGTLKEISLNGLRVNICPIGSQLMAASPSLREYNHRLGAKESSTLSFPKICSVKSAKQHLIPV